MQTNDILQEIKAENVGNIVCLEECKPLTPLEKVGRLEAVAHHLVEDQEGPGRMHERRERRRAH